MSALHGPIATADALQTLKPLGRPFARIVLREEIGVRAFGHVTEVRACTHRVKGRTPERLWKCVADSDNTRTPGCGALFTLGYTPAGDPMWTATDTTEVTR